MPERVPKGMRQLLDVLAAGSCARGFCKGGVLRPALSRAKWRKVCVLAVGSLTRAQQQQRTALSCGRRRRSLKPVGESSSSSCRG